MSNYRSQSLRDRAEHEPCIVCGSAGTTVLAHSNRLAHGKGKGIKAHDLLSIFLCGSHHDWFDKKATRREQDAFFTDYYPAQMVRVSELLQSGELKL